MTSASPQSSSVLSTAYLTDLVTNTLDPGYAAAAARRSADPRSSVVGPLEPPGRGDRLPAHRVHRCCRLGTHQPGSPSRSPRPCRSRHPRAGGSTSRQQARRNRGRPRRRGRSVTRRGVAVRRCRSFAARSRRTASGHHPGHRAGHDCPAGRSAADEPHRCRWPAGNDPLGGHRCADRSGYPRRGQRAVARRRRGDLGERGPVDLDDRDPVRRTGGAGRLPASHLAVHDPRHRRSERLETAFVDSADFQSVSDPGRSPRGGILLQPGGPSDAAHERGGRASLRATTTSPSATPGRSR